MKESVTVSGLPKAHIVSQTSPIPLTHPTSRSALEYERARRRRYVATTAPSIASARPAKPDIQLFGASR